MISSRMIFALAAAALFATSASAESEVQKKDEGCAPCGAAPYYPTAGAGQAQACFPCGEVKPPGCLGVCECPFGATRQYGILDGQTECQDIIEVGCRIPNPLNEVFEEFKVEVGYDRGTPVQKAIWDEIFASPFARQVCVAQNIFVRPFCKLPASPVWFSGNSESQFNIAVGQALAWISRYYNVEFRLVEQPDGNLKLAIRITRDDCNHYCPEGFYYAEEILVDAFLPCLTRV